MDLTPRQFDSGGKKFHRTGGGKDDVLGLVADRLFLERANVFFQADWVGRLFVLKAFVLTLFVASPFLHGSIVIGAADPTISPSPRRCQYSVRDVGFVDVHAFRWQLLLAKPTDLSQNELNTIDQRLRAILDRSNVSHLWVEPDSETFRRALRVLDKTGDRANQWQALITNTEGECIPLVDFPLTAGNADRLIDAAENLITSPLRQKILAATAKSLCVILLVESDNESLNREARKRLASAVEQLDKQMWALEKPTQLGPTGIVLERKQRPIETRVCQSLEISGFHEPSFVVLFGQGRRLGDVIRWKDATTKKLVGRAAICGGDCECDLDRQWLYGRQMIHRWPLEFERLAESSLDFDPHAAYVKSEVSQIVRKAGRRAGSSSADPSLDFGPGLIIHDLDKLESASNDPSRTTNDSESKSTKPHSTLAASNNTPSMPNSGNKKMPEQANRADSQDRESNVDPNPQQPGNSFPFVLMGVLFAGATTIFLWTLSRSSEA